MLRITVTNYRWIENSSQDLSGVGLCVSIVSSCSEHRAKPRKHSSRMRTDRAVRPSNERVVMRPIVDRQTPVKRLPSPCGR